MRNSATDRGFKVKAGHAERGVAHEVDTELIRCGDLGANGEPKSGAQLMGFAPAEVAARGGGAIEWEKLIAGTAGIMCHDRSGRVDDAHELRHHVIGRDWRFPGI